MGLSAADRQRYWRINVALVAGLMSLGFGVSFIVPYFARDLASVRLFGWSLSYYVAAQGATLTYLFLVTGYALLMGWLDRRYEARSGSSP
jgi:putative solute:sodium symporter small subunit